MGNQLEKKLKKYMTPRPDEIDFPAVKGNNTKIKVKKSENNKKFEKNRWIAKCICLLKSGNILVGIDKIDKNTYKLKSSLYIYDYPNLILKRKYIFPNQRSEMYNTSVAIQMKNGKLFIIRDKLYEFEEDSIEKGPKRTSGKLDSFMRIQNYVLPDPYNSYKKVTKEISYFNAKDIFEAIDGKVLFKSYDSIYYFDSVKLDSNAKMLFSEENAYDIIVFQSEYYSDHMYVCKNTWLNRNKTANLSIYDFKEFCNENNKTKKPLFNIEVSKSENILGYCEYNKRYLLLDTLSKGVYIIDMETKAKVAICDGEVAKYDLGPTKAYGKMLKLDDGHIVRMHGLLYIIDVRERKLIGSFIESSSNFIQKGNCLILLYDTSLLKIVEFSE